MKNLKNMKESIKGLINMKNLKNMKECIKSLINNKEY